MLVHCSCHYIKIQAPILQPNLILSYVGRDAACHNAAFLWVGDPVRSAVGGQVATTLDVLCVVHHTVLAAGTSSCVVLQALPGARVICRIIEGRLRLRGSCATLNRRRRLSSSCRPHG